MVSGASQSLAGHDPASIRSEEAECPLTDKNRVGTEKTGKREIDRKKAKRRELALQRWSRYGSMDDFG